MKTIAVTGSTGLLGLHVRSYIRATSDWTVRAGTRSTFKTADSLDAFIGGADAIVHLAGMNRGPDPDIKASNLRLAQDLVDSCRRTDSRPNIVFSNSVHESRDTAYGSSKRQAAEIFAEWAKADGGTFTNLVLANVFGEQGLPFHNSVVSTFAYQLANGQSPVVNDVDERLALLHAQRCASVIKASLCSVPLMPTLRIEPEGVPMTVGALSNCLTSIDSSYRAGLLPPLTTDIDLDLFNTYRSYLYPAHYPMLLTQHNDERGWLIEAVKGGSAGQTFISTTRPGAVRGNHFHLRKVERFLVLRGEATIRIRRLFSSPIVEFRVSSDTPAIVDIPTLHTHSLVNTGTTDVMTMFWAHEVFDPSAPDTIAEPVDAS